MIRLILCFLLFLSFLYMNIWANELPIIELQEGTNTIALTIDNQWNNDISGLTVKIKRNKIPKWISFKNVTQTINVPCGTQGGGKLYLKLIVTDAPPDADAEIPYLLSDDKGNLWSFTAIMHVNSGKPLEYALYENYPNPFNPSTTIKYSLKTAGHTKLTIYNMLGQKIQTLVNEPKTAGIHTVKWDGRNSLGEQTSSGVYFYRIEAGDFVKTKRMILIE